MKFQFESALEKIGRIIARQYNIDVVFEGDVACTDGKKIVLPMFDGLTEELCADLNGFLDHEVAHCKFTKFDEMQKCLSKFHGEMLNAVEDVRIERAMIAEFPGTRHHLEPLNAKLMLQINETWDKMPLPVRLIINIQEIMIRGDYRRDADTAPYMEKIADPAAGLNHCGSTTELRWSTEKIVKAITDVRLAEKSGGESDGDAAGQAIDQLLAEPLDGDGAGGSLFQEFVIDVHRLVDRQIKDAIQNDQRDRIRADENPEWVRAGEITQSIPFSTKYDQVTDHSGKGDRAKYAAAKRSVQSLVSPIRQQLERILKVKEAARWVTERDRGTINARALNQLLVNKNSTKIFKEFVKTETNNVAIEILVDMSGSMGGEKIDVARATCIAMAESLTALNIPFEVTGFYSVPDERVARATRGRDLSRYNRTDERLDLHIFKSFDTRVLTGLSEIHVGGFNPDGECVAWAAKRLAVRKEKRKILIVLSDGQPSTGDSIPARLCSDLKQRVKLIERSGIETVGIGILSDAVQHYYTDHIVLNDLKDLPTMAMRKLAKIVGG